jgi:hypothetical protein
MLYFLEDLSSAIAFSDGDMDIYTSRFALRTRAKPCPNLNISKWLC